MSKTCNGCMCSNANPQESVAMSILKKLKRKVFILSVIAILEFALLVGIAFSTLAYACIPDSTHTEYIIETFEKANPSKSPNDTNTRGHAKRKHNFAKKKG